MRDHPLPRIITCDSHLDSHEGPGGETGRPHGGPSTLNANAGLLPAGLRLPHSRQSP